MKKHTKVYFDYFCIDQCDFVACEICGNKAVDIHHIDARGMGGSDKDQIENLMAVCRFCHETFGDKKQFKQYLKDIHIKVLNGKSKKRF
jgi:hypothetical protein